MYSRSEGGKKKPNKILRDTGTSKSLMLKGLVDLGYVCVGIVDEIPMPVVYFLLGNGISGRKVNTVPLLFNKPVFVEAISQLVNEAHYLFPACQGTSRNKIVDVTTDVDVNLDETYFCHS